MGKVIPRIVFTGFNHNHCWPDRGRTESLCYGRQDTIWTNCPKHEAKNYLWQPRNCLGSVWRCETCLSLMSGSGGNEIKQQVRRIKMKIKTFAIALHGWNILSAVKMLIKFIRLSTTSFKQKILPLCHYNCITFQQRNCFLMPPNVILNIFSISVSGTFLKLPSGF